MNTKVLPTAWNEWTLTQEIGAGSFGTVYRARKADGSGLRESAVKIVNIPRMDQKQEDMMRGFLGEKALHDFYAKRAQAFAQEAQHMELLQGCANTVQIEDYLLEETRPLEWTLYIRMELLTSLGEDAQRREQIACSEAELVRLGEDLCRALICCEHQHLYHRDIKPANIFVDENGSYKLGDFGISVRSDRKLSRNRMRKETKGTILYMAPEVLLDGTYSPQADIYSVGMVLCRMSMGEANSCLADGAALLEKLVEGLAENRRPENISEALWSVIRRACAEDPKDRFENAEQMLEALAQVEKERKAA